MAHTKSADKRHRQNEKRRRHNRSIMKEVKTQIKTFLAVLASGDAANAEKEFRLTAKRLDKAAARNVVHPNLAARKKSNLAIKLKAVAAKS